MAHYNALAAVAHEKLSGIMVDWALLGANSQQHLQDVADKARLTFEAALAESGKYTAGFILKLQDTAIAAQIAADGFGTAFEVNLQKVDEALTATVNGFEQLEMATKASTGVAGPIQSGNASSNADAYLDALAQSIASGNVINLAGLGRMIPGMRAEGGPVDAGMPYMVGERGPELFTPSRAGVITPNGGSGGGGSSGLTVIHLVVDGRVLASVVNDRNTKTTKQGRQLPSA
jgi:hypothetical protein